MTGSNSTQNHIHANKLDESTRSKISTLNLNISSPLDASGVFCDSASTEIHKNKTNQHLLLDNSIFNISVTALEISKVQSPSEIVSDQSESLRSGLESNGTPHTLFSKNIFPHTAQKFSIQKVQT